jgi:hypothetical protein
VLPHLSPIIALPFPSNGPQTYGFVPSMFSLNSMSLKVKVDTEWQNSQEVNTDLCNLFWQNMLLMYYSETASSITYVHFCKFITGELDNKIRL